MMNEVTSTPTQDEETMQQQSNGMETVVDNLIQNTAQPDTRSFRERAKQVGVVYTMSYSAAVVAVFDHDREQAGGLPKNAFLMAAKQQPVTNPSFCSAFKKRPASPPPPKTTRPAKESSRIRETRNRGLPECPAGSGTKCPSTAWNAQYWVLSSRIRTVATATRRTLTTTMLSTN